VYEGLPRRGRKKRQRLRDLGEDEARIIVNPTARAVHVGIIPHDDLHLAPKALSPWAQLGHPQPSKPTLEARNLRHGDI
jgi:hypothetical protein